MHRTRLATTITYLVAISFSLLFYLQSPHALYAAGCTDFYDDNGNQADTLSTHMVLPTLPAQINRSLCGFYDADYVEFSPPVGATYHVEILNHENPLSYGVYLELWQVRSDGSYRSLLQTSPGVIMIERSTDSTGNLIVRVGSLRSDVGSYGGGDYQLSITLNGVAIPTPTVTSTPKATLTPTVVAPTSTSTVTSVSSPTATATTKVKPTKPSGKPTVTNTPTAVKSTSASTPTSQIVYKMCLPLVIR